MNDKNKITSLINDYLFAREDIIFAYIFGSFATGKMHFNSDIDIAIYSKNYLETLELGGIVVDLEDMLEHRIDIVILNDRPKEHPELAYRIVTEGELLFNKDHKTFVNFKTDTFLYYLDFLPVIEMFNKKFLERNSMSKE